MPGEAARHNVGLHQRAIEAFNTRDPAMLITLSRPDVEYHPVLAGLSGVTVYRGHDGLRSWFADLDEVWGDEIRAEPAAYLAWGEHTLLDYTLRGRGRRSGVEVTSPFAQVIRWRDDLIAYSKIYPGLSEALDGLGISEADMERVAPPEAPA